MFAQQHHIAVASDGGRYSEGSLACSYQDAVEIAGNRLPNALQAMAEAPAPRHHIEVGDLACDEPRRCRDVASETYRVRTAFERHRSGASDREHQPVSPDDGKSAVNSGKLREWSV